MDTSVIGQALNTSFILAVLGLTNYSMTKKQLYLKYFLKQILVLTRHTPTENRVYTQNNVHGSGSVKYVSPSMRYFL